MNLKITLPLVSLTLAICSLLTLYSSPALAQRDRDRNDSNDYERYLRRLDRNEDGFLDQNEMSGRTKSWLNNMGVNTDQRVRISDVGKAVERNRERQRRDEQAAEDDKNFTTQIPGFRGFVIETEPLPGFGIKSSNAVPAVTTTNQYSAEILEQVESTLRRYDKNNNQILDKDEIASIRWGSPKPDESDLNKDGQLDFNEMAERFKRRSDANRENNRGESSSRTRERSGGSEFSRSRRGSGSSSGGRSTGGRSSGGSSSRSSRSSGSSDRERQKRTEEYVTSLIDKYDTDKDGKLSKDEVKEMSKAPSSRADADGDGQIDFDELLAEYDGSNKESKGKSGSEEADEDDDSSSRSERSSRFSRSSRSRGNSRTGSRGSKSIENASFSDLDKDRSGVITMEEFAEDWNDELFEQFEKLDLNGDSYITKGEFDVAKGDDNGKAP